MNAQLANGLPALEGAGLLTPFGALSSPAKRGGAMGSARPLRWAAERR